MNVVVRGRMWEKQEAEKQEALRQHHLGDHFGAIGPLLDHYWTIGLTCRTLQICRRLGTQRLAGLLAVAFQNAYTDTLELISISRVTIRDDTGRDRGGTVIEGNI